MMPPRMMPTSFFVPRVGLALLGAIVVFTPVAAAAQPAPAAGDPGDPAAEPAPPPVDPAWEEAAKVFREGRAAMVRPGQLDKACELLAKSYAMKQRGDTLLNLAECHRRQGKTATAWREFDEAIRYAMDLGIPEAIAAAAILHDQLAKKLSVLIVEVDMANAPADLVVMLDGKKLPSQQWNEVLHVDPGVHSVSVTGTGLEPFEASAEVPPQGGETRLPVTPTKILPPPPPEVVPVPPPVAPEKPARAPQETPVWPFVVGGLGLTSLGVAVAFGVDNLSVGSELDELCGDGRRGCSSSYDFASARDQEVRSFALYVGLGIAGLAATTVGTLGLVLAGGGSEDDVAVAPYATPEGAGVVVRGGRF
jgi:hypothetical protein